MSCSAMDTLFLFSNLFLFEFYSRWLAYPSVVSVHSRTSARNLFLINLRDFDCFLRHPLMFRSKRPYYFGGALEPEWAKQSPHYQWSWETGDEGREDQVLGKLRAENATPCGSLKSFVNLPKVAVTFDSHTQHSRSRTNFKVRYK